MRVAFSWRAHCPRNLSALWLQRTLGSPLQRAQRLVAASSATFMLVDVHLEQYEAREKWGTRLGRGPRIFFATFFARLHSFAKFTLVHPSFTPRSHVKEARSH